ncbi:hypothetical protein LJR125_001492 [Pseudoxanthomonas sp. LjRoot125]|uniref:hypothetical protein n=1 Tax=Pseudoxanthomonas sp. LjRoot125 TaxID=3342258 RepID=UPI003E11AEA6
MGLGIRFGIRFVDTADRVSGFGVIEVPHDRSKNQWVIRAKVMACVSTQCRMLFREGEC